MSILPRVLQLAESGGSQFTKESEPQSVDDLNIILVLIIVNRLEQ